MVSNTGRGRLFLDPAKQHDDLRLLRRAIKNRWEIPEDFRDLIVGRLRDVIENGDDDIALKAISEARHLEAQNQRDQHKVIDVRVSTRHDRLDELAADLGIEISALEDATRKADSGTGGDEATAADGAP